jgi:hypothetical protein
MTNTNKELTVRELIAILETHNPDALINVRDDLSRWAEITNDEVEALRVFSRAEYVFIG